MANLLSSTDLRRAGADLRTFGQRHLPGAVFAFVASLMALPLVRYFTIADVKQELTLLMLSSLVGPLALIGVAYAVFLIREIIRERLPLRLWRSRQILYLVLLVAALIVVVAVVAAYFVDRSRGPIVFTFGGDSSPLGVSRRSNGPLWIDGFQIKGHNRSDKPISPDVALVRSDETNEIFPLAFSSIGEGLIPVTEGTIVPDADFVLIAIIPSTDPSYSQGIIVDEFRNRFARFTFVFGFDGKQIEFHFSRAQVASFIAQADHETLESLSRASRPPGVTRRSGS